MKLSIVPLLCLCLTGCDGNVNAPSTLSTPTNDVAKPVEAPTFDATTEKPTMPDVDPATIGQVNTGFMVEFSPAVKGLVKMEGNNVYWNSGAVVLVVKGDIIAYGVEPAGIRVYNRQNKGFIAPFRGSNGGVPYFGPLEER